MVNVVILGAGPAGLSAAFRLAQQGMRVEVIEAEPLVGGLCRTIQHDGFFFDLGGHRFATKDEKLEKEIKLLLCHELVTRTRCSTIWLNEKNVNYPLELTDMLKKMNVFTSIRCGFDYFRTVLKRIIDKGANSANISLEDWVTNRFGKALYSIYFGPYSAKLWGISPTLISADWADYRITLTSLLDVVLRLFKIKKDTPTTYIKNFYYPKSGGIGKISECMQTAIQENGGIIHLNSTVKGIHPEKGLINYQKDGLLCSMGYDYLISTISLPDLIHMISPTPPDEYLEAASSLRFRGIRFFNLCINKERVSDNTWIYVPANDIIFFRIQEPKNWSENNAPVGKTSLILEIACNKSDDTWNMDDELIYRLCIDGLMKMGFNLDGYVTDYFSIRTAHAYPMYLLDYKVHQGKLLEFLSRYKDIVCCGRQGLFWYNAMDEAMNSGFEAADNILDRI